jgi:hypothetical protein
MAMSGILKAYHAVILLRSTSDAGIKITSGDGHHESMANLTV